MQTEVSSDDDEEVNDMNKDPNSVKKHYADGLKIFEFLKNLD